MNVLRPSNFGTRAYNLTRRVGTNAYNLTRRVGKKIANYTGKLTNRYKNLTGFNIARDKYTYRRVRGEVLA